MGKKTHTPTSVGGVLSSILSVALQLLKGARHVSVAKVIEITSTSPGSFEDAIRKGIAKAQQSIDGIRGAWVSEHKVELAEDGTIKHFRVDMKLTFVLE